MPDQRKSEYPEVSDQQEFWNAWNAKYREKKLGSVSERQSAVIIEWMRRLSAATSGQLDIFEVGCGTGWMCERLAAFGRVTGTDLAAEVVERAQARARHIRYLAGDFMTMELPQASADIAIGLEVLSHVPDQAAFLRRVFGLMRSGGYLMLATQNRFVLERSAGVAPRAPGQIRTWVNARELRDLLEPDFSVLQLTSVVPHGYLGVLKWVNSPRLNKLVAKFAPQARIDALKERFLLGHTLMVLARKNA